MPTQTPIRSTPPLLTSGSRTIEQEIALVESAITSKGKPLKVGTFASIEDRLASRRAELATYIPATRPVYIPASVAASPLVKVPAAVRAADPLAEHRIHHATLTMGEFHQLSHAERAAYIRKGGKLTD